MIVTLILIGVFVLSLVNIIVFKNSWKYAWIYEFTQYGSHLALIFTSIILLIVGIIQIDYAIRPDYYYKQDIIEYEAIQAVVDKDTGNVIALSENISKHNQKILSYQTYHDNPWVNWFYYKGCENVPYIETKENKE